MTFLHKLARRLAALRPGLAAAVLLTACAPGEEKDFLSPNPGQLSTQLTTIVISPQFGSARPGEQIQFSARGTNLRGESLPVDVSWSASGGTISPAGLFVSDHLGQFSVTARSSRFPQLADSALVAVYSSPKDILKVSVYPDSAEITVGEGIQLEAIARLADGSDVKSPPLTWSASGGQVDGSGWFTPGSTEGTYTVEAVASFGVTGRSTVKVRTRRRSVTGIEIDPATVVMPVGQSRQFTANATYSDGSTSRASVVWSATGGAIEPDGTYSAGSSAGSYRVIARDQQSRLADSAVVTLVEPTVASLTVAPGAVSLAPTAVQQFSATATMSDGTSRPIGVTWQTAGGTMSGSGQFTAGPAEGTFRVVGTVTGASAADTAEVTIVKPAVMLTQLVLNPGQVILPVGANRQFSVSGVYSDGSTGTPAVTWSARGGTITSSGLYTAGSVQGTYQLIATEQGGSRADTSSITVTAASLTELWIDPPSASLMSGESTQFAVAGRWSDGSTTRPQVQWYAEGGTISASGLYLAGTQGGTFRVIATQQGGTLADTALVTVTVPPPTLRTLLLSPAQVALPPSGTYQFVVSGEWSNGATTAPLVTWSATGGSVNAAGLFTAGTTSGTFRVIATESGGTLADTAQVVITAAAPVLTSVVLSPASTSLQINTSRQFAVSGTWSDGSNGVPAISWSATGGTITDGGLYVAGGNAGTYRVVAAQQGGGPADTAEVTVSAPTVLTTLVVSPDSQIVKPGKRIGYSGAGIYSNGGTGTPSVTWSATGGRISSSGTYTAGGTPGTFRVIGTSGALADTVSVLIEDASLVSFTLTPDSVKLAPGAEQQFATAAVWSDGQARPYGVTFTATGGTISSSGKFAAGQVTGMFLVVATCACGSADSSIVAIDAAGLESFTLSPDSVKLAPGAAQQFATTAAWSDGQSRPYSVTFSATGGSISTSGKFTAGQVAGVFTVVAACTCGRADSSVVSITGASAPTLKAVVVTPGSATIGAGSTLQLSASGTMSDGGTSSPTVSWTTTGGSVTASGLYTAPTTEGTYAVRATEPTSGLFGESAVTVTSGSTGQIVQPELPRVFLSTGYGAPPGQVIRVAAGGNLQSALNAAACGDEIRLAAGATFTGNFVLPARACSSNPIHLRTDVTLPREGTRVTPGAAAGFAKVLSANSDAALKAAPRAHGYRIVAVEFGATSSTTLNYGLVRVGESNEATVADLPGDVVIDRVYIHGHPTLQLSRCVALNGVATAVIDSYLAECHGKGFDSQAIGAWSGPGPFKIVNNYLEGAGENLLFGGADPGIQGLVPSDIEIRRNHVFKPLAWQPGAPWSVKNLLELKNASRVLIEANVFENHWVESQSGSALVLTARNQGGNAPWSTVSDVVVRFNVIKNVPGGFTFYGDANSGGLNRVLVEHNLLVGLGANALGGFGRTSQILSGVSQLALRHNTTLFAAGDAYRNSAIYFANGVDGLVAATDNILEGGLYGVFGDGKGSGLVAVTAYAPHATIKGNVISGGDAKMTGNWAPADVSAIGFTALLGGDYSLSAGSPYRGKGTDGTDPGVNFSALMNAVAGVAP